MLVIKTIFCNASNYPQIPPLLKQQNHMQEEQKAVNSNNRALNETMRPMRYKENSYCIAYPAQNSTNSHPHLN